MRECTYFGGNEHISLISHAANSLPQTLKDCGHCEGLDAPVLDTDKRSTACSPRLFTRPSSRMCCIPSSYIFSPSLHLSLPRPSILLQPHKPHSSPPKAHFEPSETSIPQASNHSDKTPRQNAPAQRYPTHLFPIPLQPTP